MTLLARASRRYHLRHPAQFILALAGIALGVAVVVAIDLANESARRAFAAATDSAAGAATDQIVGGADGLDEELFFRLRRGTDGQPGLRASAPVVEGVAVLQRMGSADADSTPTLRLLGVDPWSEAPFRSSAGAGLTSSLSRETLARFLTRPGAMLLERSTAERLGLEVGASLAVEVDGREAELFLVGLLAPATASDSLDSAAFAHLALVDLATAQEVLARPGRLSRIDLALPDGAPGEALRRELRGLLPDDARLVRAGGRTEALEQMTRAFRFNLRALSLLALLCGTFLIYNSMTFSVVQRRSLFGRLRALGVRRRELLALVLTEAAVLGAVGSAAGVALGVVLGRGLMQLVLQTIRDLYFARAVGSFALSPSSLAVGFLLGVAASLLAALPAALEAATAPPRAILLRSDLEERAGRRAPRAAAVGLLLGLAGAAVLTWATRSLPASLGGFFLVLLGFAFALPLALAGAMRAAARAPRSLVGLFGRMAARSVAASISRTGVAVAALTVAVSVAISIAVMIGSFRQAVTIWLEGALVGDVYVSPAAPATGGGSARLAAGTVEAIRALPGIARINTLRTLLVETPGELPARLAGIDLDRRSLEAMRFKEGEFESAWRELTATNDAAILTEPFAYRRGLHLHDRFELETRAGRKSFRVVGIDYDYGSDQGIAMFAVEPFLAAFGDPGVSALALFAAPGTDLERLAAEVERAAPGGSIQVQASRALKRRTIEIFDRTFEITGVLRLLAISVAFLGILAALAALELERGREFAVLRAQGLTRRQQLRLVAAETGWLGLSAGLFALPLGALLAALMVHVINRRSFGWSMEIVWTARPFLEALALAIGAALLAGLVPAWRLGRTDPARALQEE